MSTTKSAAHAFVEFLSTDCKDDQYEKFEAEENEQNVVSSLRLVEQIFPDQALMLCNRSHPKLQYVSRNSKDILGVSPQDFCTLSVYDFFKLVHPADLKGLQQCFDFMNDAEPYDPATHRFVLYYRFRDSNGKYIHMRDEKLAIKNENKKYIYFTLFKKLNLEQKFFNVKLDIHQFSKGNLIKVYSYNPRQPDNFITPRQNDIIKLIIQGLSNQEIADQLNLSVNTIKNHKQVLFRRTNVRSSVELASYARDMIPAEIESLE
jgi:DNA-binding CsgD family transcriptional regulator